MSDNETKKKIKTAAIVLAVGCLVPLIFYTYRFHSHKLSNDPEQWGQLGDYIGGIVNPILSLANLVALVYLTFTISQVEENRDKSNRTFQRKLLLSELRQNALKEFIESKNHFFDRIEDLNLLRLSTYIDGLVHQYKNLFTCLRENRLISDKVFVLCTNLNEMFQAHGRNHEKTTKAAEDLAEYIFSLIDQIQRELENDWTT